MSNPTVYVVVVFVVVMQDWLQADASNFDSSVIPQSSGSLVLAFISIIHFSCFYSPAESEAVT